MDDDGRLAVLEAKLDRLIDAIARPAPTLPLLDDWLDSYKTPDELPEPVMVPIEDVPGPDEPDRPTLPAFPRPVEVQAPLPPPAAAVDPGTGSRLEEPIGATPVALETGENVRYSPSRVTIANSPDVINREFFAVVESQRRMVPIEDRPR